MSTFQKGVKYFALFLAFSIILAIVSAIFSGFYFLVSCFDEKEAKDMKELITIEEKMNRLEVSLKGTSFQIVEGEKASLWSNRDKLDCKIVNGMLTITEKGGLWNNNHQVVLYLPKGQIFDEVKLENGAGRVEIEHLNTKVLEFEMGAGKTIFEHLTVTSHAKMEGGAGSLELKNASIHNLDFDMGVGKVDIDGTILGRSNIDGGVGKVDLHLAGGLNSYTFDMKKGISSITFNQETISNDKVIGSGENYIKVESGIGAIDIKTSEEGAF